MASGIRMPTGGDVVGQVDRLTGVQAGGEGNHPLVAAAEPGRRWAVGQSLPVTYEGRADWQGRVI